MRYDFEKYVPTEILSGHMKMGGKNDKGESIFVNSRYIEINGKSACPVMGEYHFARDNSENWYGELCKMRAGGVEIAATYLFWIYHEEIEGKISFEGDLDVRKFVLDAEKAGLKVILRIGPWAHGECRNGGFPDWLLKKGWQLRKNDPEYLKKVRIWYKSIFDQVHDLIFKDGGNIIGIQLENELVDQSEHLMTLKEIAKDVGFDVPLYTVTGWNTSYGARIPVDEVLPVFGGYPEAPWTGHINELKPSVNLAFNKMRNDSSIGKDLIAQRAPDGWRLPYERYPFATCEMGGGVQVTRHRRPIIRPMDVYALSLTKLGSGSNLMGYYMYHGGVNKIGRLSTFQESKLSGYPNDYAILDYDFQAPLSQYGQVRGQYRLLNLLHMFMHSFGDTFADMETVLPENPAKHDDLETLRYAMRTNGESGFLFVNHHLRLKKLKDVKGAEFDMGPVKFPKMDIEGEKCFIFPFNLKLGDNMLEYATAQLLSKVDNTYFFAAIDGITPEYKFTDGSIIRPDVGINEGFEKEGARIVTIAFSKAVFARLLDDEFYIGNGCDLYKQDGQLKIASKERSSYFVWKENKFIYHDIGCDEKASDITVTRIDEAPFDALYLNEVSDGRNNAWYRVCVSNEKGFVSINERCDYAQIYADGELIADIYYIGVPWQIPAKLLYGKKCYLLTTELKNDFYREFV